MTRQVSNVRFAKECGKCNKIGFRPKPSFCSERCQSRKQSMSSDANRTPVFSSGGDISGPCVPPQKADRHEGFGQVQEQRRGR